ncbi:uncharacterized protein LOC111882227 [Lactuca sativa]|nr:uncharacterized protein LOC111882227 [Lactuca sativa]
MDRKTLERSLNKLQEDGHCKCISFAIPSATNCGRKRTVDVILHPSVYKSEDLSDTVHEKIRSFEKLIRAQSFPRHTNGKSKSIPVLNNVERIPTKNDVQFQSETFIAMRENGFVLAKMVRVKLLHVFLWGYLTLDRSREDDVYEGKNQYSSCKLFELDSAIKAMPLELFLQVAGSPVKLDSMIEKCRNGIRLSDLPIQEYRSLMDTRATSRLSYLIDILRRLKLIRLIGGEFMETSVGPHTTTTATLRHSLELKPYIEEPVTVVLPSPGVNSFDLRPHVRHDFVLGSRKGVEEYWNTLEYCYSASDPKAALHAFPGSAVHEVFLSRSWAAVRVMTAHQRAELLKLVANDDSNQKISYKKCEKIAEDLNLTLEQVLRVFYDKRQKHKLKGATSTKDPPTNALITYKRKRSSKGKGKTTLMENLLEESSKVKHPKLFHEDNEISASRMDDMDAAADDDVALTEDEDGGQSYSVSKLQQPTRTERFPWTETTDRLLVIEYIRHRAALGAKFHRVEWSSLENLPAPPETCRRRMSALNRNNQFRKAVMRLCNMLSVRYAKHLEYSKNKTLIHNRKPPDVVIHPSNELDVDEKWDDFDNKDIKISLDEVLQYKQISKSAATKGGSNCPRFNEFDQTASIPRDELLDSGRREASGRRSRRRYLPKSYDNLMNRGKGFSTQTYKSLAVSNAIELFKLIFVSTAKAKAKAPAIPNLLAETLRRYSEHDLFTAFNYLRDRKFMVRGNDASHFVLSQQFLHGISSSPFPVNTGKRAVKMARWIHEKEDDLLEYGVNLPVDLQCGDVVHLCVLMCSGEVSLFPCLPDEGVGEIEELKKRKRECDDKQEQVCVEKTKKPKILDSEIFSRKEKGFPGIQLCLNRSFISRVDAITFSRDGDTCSSVSNSSPSSVHVASSESTWEAMSSYARHVASSGSFNPNMFQTVYSAIQKAGDQGLSMEGISQQEGGKMGEVIVEVLEAFGRVLKVNAYDYVHVVDSMYRSKYLLASSMASHQHQHQHQHEHDLPHLKEPQTSSINDELQQENHTDDEVHRVTILNRPEPEENETNKNVKASCSGTGAEEGFCIGDGDGYKPIVPWVNGDGSMNEIVYKGLVRRVLGIVMQNPGILEDQIISQMNVLNPQSCRKLLELMILDSHIRVRKMYASVSNEPPAMLRSLFGCSFNKPNLVFRQHFYANPTSIDCL